MNDSPTIIMSPIAGQGSMTSFASPRKRKRSLRIAPVPVEVKANEQRGPELNTPRKRSLFSWLRKLILFFLMILWLAMGYLVTQRMNASGIFSSEPVSQDGDIVATGGRARQAPQVFTVDRSILERLEYLHRASGDLDELDVATWNGRWPPLVTHVPEPGFPNKKPTSYGDIVNLCDPQSNSRNACRFLLPYRVAEQESKARLHFAQLVFLAQALNRTLILPNVGKSRMGICLGWDFDTYYDLSGLMNQGIQFARLDILKAWVDLQASRRRHVSGQFLNLAEKSESGFGPDQRPNADFELQATDFDDIDTGCFRSRLQNLNMTEYGAVSLAMIFSKKVPLVNIGDKLVNTIQDAINVPQLLASGADEGATALKGPDILVLNWDLRHPVFPLVSFELRYSPRLIDLACDLSPPGPYLSVHWRVETIVTQNLPQCAYALIDTLANMLHDPSLAGDIKFIWLASDMPFTTMPKAAKSGTLKELTFLHEEAAQIVRSAFETGGALADWSLQTLEEKLNARFSFDDHHLDWIGDSGVRGILDKIIAAQATLFVSGSRRCSRVR
ncbi:hypothetical protein APHAL10511_008109 [Amanita phalloides]|nr:hypothetical protein APHAL10511_008109 [Amanita phalloides]